MSNKLEIIEESKGIRFCDCDGIYYIELDKGAVASGHIHDEQEIIYLLKGKAEYTVNNKTKIIEAPIKIVIPPKVYHKFVAITDCVGIETKTKN